MRKTLCIITASIMIGSMLSGCSILQKVGLMESDELQPVSSIVMNEEEAKKLTDKMPISLYFATQDDTKLKLEIRYIDLNEGKKSVNNLAGVIVKELIKGPADNTLKSTIPQETKLLNSVAIDGGVATVNLSKEFLDKHPGGEAAAKMTIYSIVNSLTEMKEVQKVKFLINGKPQADFKGAYKFDTAFPRTVSLISNEVGRATETSKDNSSSDKSNTGTENTQQNTKQTPAPAKKEATTPKPAATPAPNSSTNKSSSNVQSSNPDSEDAEATYLDVLE